MSEAVRDLDNFVQAIPYARFLGISVDRKGDEITTVLKFDHKLIGNPLLPALHGGVIGAFLEMTSIIQLSYETGTVVLPKPIGITIDYLRSGKPLDTYGRARITKQGRRVATVQAEAWQEGRARIIATVHGHFLLKTPEGSGA